MRPHRVFACAPLFSILLGSGCATITLPDTPATLHPPAGQDVYLEALASGVQIYECMSKPAEPSTYEWIFRAPEAALVDRSGRPLGKHYAGPTWESVDGSTVVGEVKARDPGPNPSAIPWLLLSAKATTGQGTFSQAKSIQRVQTVGGVAPSEPCNATNANQVTRVPYTATYYFYRTAPPMASRSQEQDMGFPTASTIFPPSQEQSMGPRIVLPATGGPPVVGIPLGGNIYMPVTGGDPIIGIPTSP
jgi:hypothetical protein